ncbi:MAG: InlB B-repeat-containing protein [Solirubrobacterales bacterium]
MRADRRCAGVALFLLAAMVLLAPAPAGAAVPSHSPLFTLTGKFENGAPVPPPEGEFEDACGVAVDSEGDLYVSDYYHRTIDVYGPFQEYLTQIQDPEPDGPCTLAVDVAGNVYVNDWRRDVIRFAPDEFPPSENMAYGEPTVVDFPTAVGARATGVFLDPASGDLYVDDRTYVAVYEAAALAEPEPEPTRIVGLGSIGQGYGIAVSDFPATEGDIYVPEAATGTLRVFDSSGVAIGELDGAGTPQHGFVSLLDSNVAIDQSDGHVFVADDLEPGFESPAVAVDEFNAEGEYRGQLPGSFLDAQPSALAVDAKGDVFVTSGNTEGAAIYGFGPTEPAHRLEVKLLGSGEGTVSSQPSGISCSSACAAEYAVGEEIVLTAIPAPGSAFTSWTGCNRTAGGRCTVILGSDRTVSAEFGPAPISPGAPVAQTSPIGATDSTSSAGPRPPAAAPGRRHRCRRHRHCRHVIRKTRRSR